MEWDAKFQMHLWFNIPKSVNNINSIRNAKSINQSKIQIDFYIQLLNPKLAFS